MSRRRDRRQRDDQRQRRAVAPDPAPTPPSDPALHRPFAGLRLPSRPQAVEARPASTTPARPPAADSAPRVDAAPRTGRLADLVRAARETAAESESASEDPAVMFARAVAGVRRLEPGAPARVESPPLELRARAEPSEDDEALATLADLVAGTGTLDVTDTREYFEGRVAGLDLRILKRLRRGEFSWQAHLDLHGSTLPEARDAVTRFLGEAHRAGRRCVLVVHGRGLNSPDGVPVLKEALKRWLSTGRLSRQILAFATARPRDGGAGALYVLLRRDRGSQRVRLNDGPGEE